MSDDKLAAVELTKLIDGLRSGPPMTDEDVFKLYRECLTVVREESPGEAAQSDQITLRDAGPPREPHAISAMSSQLGRNSSSYWASSGSFFLILRLPVRLRR
jgi:hypothetical protein